MSTFTVSKQSAFLTGIPAGAAIIGSGLYTRGFVLQVREEHPSGAATLTGHYKLLHGATDELVATHMPVSSQVAKNMSAALCKNSQNKFENVRTAILDTIGVEHNAEQLNEHMFHPKHWSVFQAAEPGMGESKEYDEERLIDTDAGEECDDEFTLIEECCYAALRQNIMLKVMFTDKHGRAEIDTFIELCGGKDFSALPNIEFFTPEGLTPRTRARKYSLLQIGPNTAEIQNALLGYYNGVDYNYVLLGMPGTTNSKKHFKELWNGALVDERYIVDTANGEGAFKFKMSDIASKLTTPEMKQAFRLGSSSEDYLQRSFCMNNIQEHVARIGFRNLCGRAFPYVQIPGRRIPIAMHICHLVAADARGANFQTAFGVATEMFADIVNHSIEETVIRMRDFRSELNDEIDAVVETYVQLMKANGLAFDGNGLSNGLRVQVTEQQIRDGYGFILKVCRVAFGVPVAFFVSGSPGNWESQWFDGEFKQLAGDVYERTDDSLDAPMAAAFQKWHEEINERDIETSPAYDVVGGRFSRGGFERYFDKESYHTEDMNMGWRVTMKKGEFTLRTL